jgi:hypothetical protein
MDLTIDVNHVPWTHIGGTDGGITVRHADGTVLSALEYQAFLDMFDLPGAVEFAAGSLFGPCEKLMGA